MKELNANLQIVVAFRMLPKAVWQMPEYGTFNLHASLLPDYRGAAPINWAIINGETKTGVTTFFIDEKIDTGNIILKEEVLIGDEEIVGEFAEDEDSPTNMVRPQRDGSVIVAGSITIRELNRLTTWQLPTDDAKTLSKIEEELDQHIRFEERVLFPEIQKVATEAQMRHIEKIHQPETFEDKLDDEFWK